MIVVRFCPCSPLQVIYKHLTIATFSANPGSEADEAVGGAAVLADAAYNDTSDSDEYEMSSGFDHSDRRIAC